MSKNGLTMTIVFVAESANYGEGLGNISNIKKMTRGNASQYSYISRQAIRYNIVQQAEWDNTPVEDKSGVVQFAPSATIEDYPEIDLFGYMKTMAKDDNARGGASTRSAVARLSNAISLEPYQGELEFLTNMGLAKRQNLDNGIAQSEIHRSYYAYTISVDLDRVGIDGEINVSKEEKAKRVKTENIKPNNNQSTELIVKEESVDINKKVHIIKRILKKFTKLFKSKRTIERIGD